MNERMLDHVGIAVRSLDDALSVWEPLTGTMGSGRERVDAQGVEVVFVGSGAGRIELLAPARPDSTVAHFLDRHGEGMHHLCYRVPDVAAALDEFRAGGYQLIDAEPRSGAHGHRVAFLHPRSSTGVLIELQQQAGPGQ